MIGTIHKCHKFIVTVHLVSKAYQINLSKLDKKKQKNKQTKKKKQQKKQQKTLRKLQTKCGDHLFIYL
jgi:hypothetical protein